MVPRDFVRGRGFGGREICFDELLSVRDLVYRVLRNVFCKSLRC